MKKSYLILSLIGLFLPGKLIAQQTEIIPLLYDVSGYENGAATNGGARASKNDLAVPNDFMRDAKDTIASIKGEININANGALTYSVLIDVLKGVNDFQPNLGLVYNSQSGNGQAGWGWNISGLSMITAGGRSASTDMLTIGPQFDGRDPFYLDGERLVAEEPNRWVTEKYSKIKITEESDGEYSFTVKYTDGRIAKYKELKPGLHYIVLLKDALGNEIHYHYEVKSTVYIKSISYDSRRTTIRFEYTARKQPQTIYRNGQSYTNTDVLSSVEVHRMEFTFPIVNQLYRKYRITHDRIQGNTVERIVQIDVENESGESLRPLSFNYNTSYWGQIELNTKANSRPSKSAEFGSVAIGDFQGNDIPHSIYELKYKGGKYRLWDSENGDYIGSDYNESQELFKGKFLHNNKILDNDYLITVHTEYLDHNTIDLLTFTMYNLVSNSSHTIELRLPGVLLGDNNRRDKIFRKLLVGDFNNDGLVDVVIFQVKGKNIDSKCFFWELGKHEQVSTIGREGRPPEIKFERGDEYEVNDHIYPIEFDGDGIPEFMFVKRYQYLKMYKLDLLDRNHNLRELPLTSSGGHSTNFPLYNFNRNVTPIIFGDFNGDGLMDFMTPEKVYSLDDYSSEELLRKIETDQLKWWQYISTGKTFIQRLRDFTPQKLAYIKPSERNSIKRSSDWAKFWSGKKDKYRYTDYGSANIIAMDINNDGRTDLISIRKFGRVKYNDDNLWDTTFLNDDLADFENSNQINFHFNVQDDAHHTFFNFKNNSRSLSLKGRTISPLSLFINITDQNQLNTYKSGLVIHDPLAGLDTKIVINNDEFCEGQISRIVNGGAINQQIEYRPLTDFGGVFVNTHYRAQPTDLPFPFFISKKAGNHYLAHKVHTESVNYVPSFRFVNGKFMPFIRIDYTTMTKEYRYQNAVQHLLGKGFLGFQKTLVSDSYESIMEDGQYQIKSDEKGVFWTVNTFDPLLDNVLKKKTYGSLTPDMVLTTKEYTNQKFEKNNRYGSSRNKKYRYLILTTAENTIDHLKDLEIKKSYKYDAAGDLLLLEAITNYPEKISQIEQLDYLPEFSNGEHYFFGKIRQIVNKKIDLSNTKPGWRPMLGRYVFTNTEEIEYNDKGLVTRNTKWGNNTISNITSSFTYFPFGGLKSETIVAGSESPLITRYQYEKNNRYVSQIKTSDGLITKRKTDFAGRLTTETNGWGQKTTFQYDGWGNVRQIVDFLGNKTDIKKQFSDYGPYGSYALSKKTDGEPEVITTYDPYDRPIETKTKSLNNQWVFSRTQYDVFGRPISSSQPFYNGEWIRWNSIEYDGLSRPIKYVLFNGKEIINCYEGAKITTIDGDKTSSKWVNSLGQVIKYQDQGGTINYKYHLNGSLKETEYDGMKTTIDIDGWGYQKKLVDPSAGTYLYQYDELGRLKQLTNPKGGVTSYQYNKKGKILSENTSSVAENTEIVADYHYDAVTTLPTAIIGTYNGKNFAYSTTYDQHFRIDEKVEETPDFTYQSQLTYDEFGRIKTTATKTTFRDLTQSSDSHLENIYDQNGILVQQLDKQKAGLIWEVHTANANGLTTQMQFGNGYTLNAAYNNTTDVLEGIRHFKANTTAVDIKYRYDALKGVLLQRDNLVFGRDEGFIYDRLDRLVKETVNASVSRVYTYDQQGKMTSNSQFGKYLYENNTYRLKELKYNNLGLQLGKDRGFANIAYNAFKSPVEIDLREKNQKISFDHSILKTRNSASFNSLRPDSTAYSYSKWYSADKAVEVIREEAQTKIITYVDGDPYTASYIKMDLFNGPDLQLSKNYFLHRDNQQSILAITEAEVNAEVVEQRDFDAWGNLRQAYISGVLENPDQLGWDSRLLIDRGYTGHEHLGSVGLLHMNGRIYDPELRRFMSPDNYVQEPFNTQSFNRYGYVLNNPLLYTDPSGEFWGSVATGVAIAVVVKGISNMINFTPFWHGMGKSAVIGGVSGAISSAIGSVAESVFTSTVNQALFQSAAHGLSSGVVSSIDGGDFASGFASGAVSSLISSGIQGLGTTNGNVTDFGNSTTFKAIVIAAGGLSGGLSSTIAGGNFWLGARQGLISSGLNHVAHQYITIGNQGGDPEEACGVCSGVWGDGGGFWKNLALFLYKIDPEGQSFDDHMNQAISEGAPLRYAGIQAFHLTKAENGGLSFVPIRGVNRVTAAKGGGSWIYGAFKSEAKWAGQLSKRGWTAEQITEAVTKGKSFDAVNMVNKANSATRHVHPTTGQSVVIDNVTKELLHVGGPGFKY